MAFRTLISPNFGAQAEAGACLIQAQQVVGALGGPYSATQAGNNVSYPHYDRDFPSDAIVVVWFWHWGTYWNYIERRWTTEDYGHVVIRSPSAFGVGQPGYYSSPRNGYGGEWFRTIEEVEAAFNSKYRMWSEDLNGVRVCEPVTATIPPAVSQVAKPPIHGMENDMLVYYAHAFGKKKPGWLVLGYTPKPLILSTQKSANEWGRRIGKETISADFGGFKKYLAAAGGTPAQLSAVSAG